MKILKGKIKINKKDKKKFAVILNLLGNILILLSFLFLFFTFGPATTEEIKYQTRQVLNIEYSVDAKPEGKVKNLTPPNKDFSIVIPKIGAVAPVVANVDPVNPENYLSALRRGVAHAANTAMPGGFGNTYIFAHSTDSFYNVGAYNAVFYLLGKLTEGDKIYLYYEGEEYVYIVSDKRVVSPEDVKYLGKQGNWNTLTLQTCYPPGTTLKRLVVIANQIN
jgi:sortase A